MSKICIAGEWHQAIVVGACLADAGHDVVTAVVDPGVAERLRSAVPPVHEPELPELMARGMETGRLEYTTSFTDALRGAEYAFISLDTPIADDDTPDLDDVIATARRIAAGLSGDVILVVTAQVPVGTCERLRDIVAAESGFRIGIAYVPEFLRLGHAVRTFVEADRFIIGADDAAVGDAVQRIYEPFGRPLRRMGLRSAEMAKHASNAFLALSISFTNEIADLCSESGADVAEVTAGMKLDRRIGAHAFLGAGLGFAGGTLGRDLRALQELGRSSGRSTHLADAALEVNRSRAGIVRRELERQHGSVRGLRIGILGLTYKAGTSTMRRSVALEIMRDLHGAGVELRAYDPLADMSDVEGAPTFVRTAAPEDAADDADALVLVTEWDGIREMNMRELAGRMRHPLFIDTRNLFEPHEMADAGFTYAGVGRSAGQQQELAV